MDLAAIRIRTVPITQYSAKRASALPAVLKKRMWTLPITLTREIHARWIDFLDNESDIYILLDVLLCSIAEYFYELCRILTSP